MDNDVLVRCGSVSALGCRRSQEVSFIWRQLPVSVTGVITLSCRSTGFTSARELFNTRRYFFTLPVTNSFCSRMLSHRCIQYVHGGPKTPVYDELERRIISQAGFYSFVNGPVLTFLAHAYKLIHG